MSRRLSVTASLFWEYMGHSRTFANQGGFDIAGHYDFANHLTALAEVDFKPSEIFNCTTNFNGISVRAGLTYRF